MSKRIAALLCALPMLATGVFAQGLNTNATKDDWEEINFEFNSSVLVDGFQACYACRNCCRAIPDIKSASKATRTALAATSLMKSWVSPALTPCATSW